MACSNFVLTRRQSECIHYARSYIHSPLPQDGRRQDGNFRLSRHNTSHLGFTYRPVHQRANGPSSQRTLFGNTWRSSRFRELRHYGQDMEYIERRMFKDFAGPLQPDLRHCFRWKANSNWELGYQCQNMESRRWVCTAPLLSQIL